jgi:hypothetical protein
MRIRNAFDSTTWQFPRYGTEIRLAALYASIEYGKFCGRKTYSMVLDLLEYPWVIKPIVEFVSKEHLMELLPSKVIEPAEEKFKERQALLNQLFYR